MATWALLASGCATIGVRQVPLPVPPHLEIEVIDPGVDPVGNPAVRLQDTGTDTTLVDIPPTVLVHRYYYSGDRSFQGPLLPGGPTIVVANHPITGERCYIELQMLPGAPRVLYSGRSIEYDYGSHSTIVRFPKRGCPTVVYRNGATFSRAVADAIHLEEWRANWRESQLRFRENQQRCQTMAKGAMLELGDGLKLAMLPVVNATAMFPLVAPITTTDWESRWAARVAEHEQQVTARKSARQARLRELDRPTIR
ncbi:MAG TPA: hypothetical protein PKD54_01350 [Pirellulaceae bacterium]|nr:hypothetical protein [Pirellulaceae bacterium]